MPISRVVTRAAFCASLAATFASQTIGASAQAPIVMKMGTPTVNDHQVQWMKFFKTALEKDSKGKIEVQIYPNSQLGSAPRMIEGVQFNSIQGVVLPPEFLVGVDPRFQMMAAPAVFTSAENIQKTFNDKDFRASLASVGEPKGLMLIGAVGAAPFQVYTKKPVRRLTDLQGLKIRVLASPIAEKQISLFGGTGVPMPLDQVMPAVQQGALDGVVLSIVTAPSFKFETVAKYGTELRQSYVTAVAEISKTWFDALAPDLKAAVLSAAKTADMQIVPWTKTYVTDSYAQWKAGGGEMFELPKADLDEEHAKLAGLGAEIFASSPEATKMYQLMLATAAKNR